MLVELGFQSDNIKTTTFSISYFIFRKLPYLVLMNMTHSWLTLKNVHTHTGLNLTEGKLIHIHMEKVQCYFLETITSIISWKGKIIFKFSEILTILFTVLTSILYLADNLCKL